ncbi:hypothetical protein DSECCO2_208490 [anaerobic digester metagenome]
MSTRANIIRDKGRPPKGANAEERRCLIFFSLVVRLITVQLSLVPPMERYEAFFFALLFFYCMQNFEVGACRLFLFFRQNLSLEHIPQRRRIRA